MKLKSCFDLRWLALPSVLLPAVGFTAGFAAGVSPSKFELTAKPGEVLRDTVRILNPNNEAAEFELSTADWRLNDQSGVEFIEDQLVDGSCRPWVRLERKTVQIPAGEEKNYRFEVHVPPDAPPGLCRFAILIQPSQAAEVQLSNDQISFPDGRPLRRDYVCRNRRRACRDRESRSRRDTAARATRADAAAEELLATTTTARSAKSRPSTATASGSCSCRRAFRYCPVAPKTSYSRPMLRKVTLHECRCNIRSRSKGRVEIGGTTFEIDETLE